MNEFYTPMNDMPQEELLSPREGARAYNRLGFGYLLLTIGYLLGSALVMVLLNQFAPAMLNNDWIGMLSNYLALYLVGFPLLCLVMCTVPDRCPQHEKKKLSVGSILMLYAFSMMAAFLFNLVGIAINNAIGTVVPGYNADTVIDWESINAVVLFICGVIVAPIMEEVIFRWIPYKKNAAFGPVLYFVYTGIAFGLFHMNLAQFFYAAALGILFAKITYDTGTVKYSIILHLMVNLTGGVGIGGLIIRTNNWIATAVYSAYNLLIVALGLIVAIWFLVTRRHRLKNAPATHPVKVGATAFLNPGTILYTIVILCMIVVTIISIGIANTM